MSTRTDAPADTTMMRIVHSALRRDLVRAQLLLAGETLSSSRRTALADHLLWMMTFLHHHHRTEDDGLYPMVVRRNPDAAALVEVMDADHSRIVPAIGGLEVAARAYQVDAPGSQGQLLEAVRVMDEVMFPHLEREELQMMPVVAASITRAEWSAWDQESNVKPKGMLQLADEGHWLLDGLGDEDRQVVVHLVPPVPRFILVRLMDGRYRRKRAALWDGTPAAAVPSLSIEAAKGWA